MEEQIKGYLNKLKPQDSPWVKNLKIQAEKDHIPIMEDDSMHFLMQLTRIKQPAAILEVGTAIGYSALRMSEACPKSKIITIEKDEKRYNQAVANITGQDKANTIRVIYNDAIQEMERLLSNECLFDIIFIDAAKGQYKQFFEKAMALLKPDGVIVTDNVLFRGYVAEDNFEHPRYQKMVKRIKTFNDWICRLQEYDTAIFPIGDGVAVSCKKQ
ncbi:O-methyltransferase [Virgibacillus halophilus]|uniref:tRNA 5-hydroxyuridine methyltransferase n=1 Tax=Tigheibacillus halophilus TaxID=361280 RepID=A0ABU5CC43_9BACI|nr:O-methyltransferase [Virgibacillus halophilus]